MRSIEERYRIVRASVRRHKHCAKTRIFLLKRYNLLFMLFFLRYSESRKLIGAAATALLLATACAAVDELNSERIRRLYGNYGVEIVAQTESLRVTNLYSSSDGVKTCRTLAIVRFAPDASRNFASAHDAIVAGASIGETLAREGFALEKTTRRLDAFRYSVTPSFLQRLMRIEGQTALALHVYDLSATRAGVAMKYATIAELHHPAYWSAAELGRHLNGTAITPLTAAERANLDALVRRVSQGRLD